MTRIATVTLNPSIDATCEVKSVRADDKLRSTRPVYEPGGGGLNVARAGRRLGGEMLALWTRGRIGGPLLEELLDDEWVEHHPLYISSETRENLIVFESTSGRQFRFVMPGPELSEEEREAVLTEIRGLDPAPGYLVLSGSLPPGVPEDFYARITAGVTERTRVVVDTSGPALKHGLARGTYLIKPNIRELGHLAGHEIEGDEGIREVSRELISAGKAEVVVTSLGSGGVVTVTAEGCDHVRSPTVKIRSKVGAGDSTVAGIVVALSQGRPLDQAVRFGVAAGAAAVMTEGTQLCRQEDTERLFAKMNEE